MCACAYRLEDLAHFVHGEADGEALEGRLVLAPIELA